MTRLNPGRNNVGLVARDIIIKGTSPDTAGTANTSTRIELDSNASAVDGAYDPGHICITGGTGVGQSRQIFEYDGTNKYAYVNRDWKVIPDNTSVYAVGFHTGNSHVNEGVAQAGANNTITLNALASAQNSLYLGQMLFIVAGTGADQARMCIGYDGTTKIATVDANWIVNPDATSVYATYPYPGFVHGVPAADSAANILIRDVIGNKTDTHSGNSILGQVKQIREHIHSTIFIRPQLAGSITLTSDAGVWAAYNATKTEIIAAGNITDDFDLHFMNISAMSANGEYEIALYTGLAGVEVLVGEFGAARNAVQSQEGSRPIVTPLFPANTRISAALSSSNAGANTLTIKVEGHEY